MKVETLIIKDIFQKDIDRDINGVIQAGQLDETSVFQELDEYVVTDELAENLADFYRHYARSLKEPTAKIGVWISGFFGSGKSHLLKILSYHLDNRIVQGRHALEFFRDKAINPGLLQWMEEAASVQSDALLFNIDSKSSTGSQNQKQKIVDVFLKVFNEHLGYSSTGWIAEIERMLDAEGKYQAFQAAYAETAGKSWVESRQSILLKQKEFVQAMGAVAIEEDAARTFLKTTRDNFEISPEELAKRIAAYCRSRGKAYRLIFLIDEIGQYIGDSPELMLNLQTVVEDLGNHARGQAWVIVTSQEKIDAVTKVIGDDFSKIQGRFSTRLNLSSANTDEVIKRRLLAKTEVAEQTLSLQYEAVEQLLRNMLCFDNRTAALRAGFSSVKNFTSCYPFVPYQFELLQKVFEKIRKQGEAGKHLSHAERSLLNAFQEVAQKLKEENTRKLATFADFYQTIESFLDTSVKSTVRKAANPKRYEHLEAFDLEVLKTLYMIKGIEILPATLDNITTLLLDSLDAVKSEAERRVRQALERLERYMLIQQNADQTYVFLSDEEQEINREIKNTIIDPNKVIEAMGKVFFDDIYPKSRYRFSTGHDFDFTKRFNDYTRGTTAHQLALQVFTPEIIEGRARLEANSGTLVMHLQEANIAAESFEYALQIQEHVRAKDSLQKSPAQKRIFDEKRADINAFEEKGKLALIEVCKQAAFYVQGQEYRFSGEVVNQLDNAFEVLVRNTFTKLGYLEERVEVKQAGQVVVMWAKNGLQLHLDGSQRNQLALQELERYLEEKQGHYVRTTFKILIDDFSRSPYGWSENDIAGLIALLVHQGRVKLSYAGERFDAEHPKFSERLLKQVEREKVIVDLEVTLPSSVRNQVLRLLREYFEPAMLGDTYDAVASEIRRQIAGRMQEPLRRIKQRRGQEKADFPYPGGMTVLRLRKLVEEILAKQDAEDLVREFLEREDEYEEWFDNLDEMQGFYLKSAINYFDAAVQTLQQRKSDLLSAHNQVETQSIKLQIEAILRNEKPYLQISQLPVLLKRLDDQLKELMDKKRAELLPKFNRLTQTVNELAVTYHSDQEIAQIIAQEQTNLHNALLEYQEVGSIGELMIYADLAETKVRVLQDRVQAMMRSKQTKAKPEPDKAVRKEKALTPKALASLAIQDTELRIATSNELDLYLQQLRREMERLLDQHVLIIKKYGE